MIKHVRFPLLLQIPMIFHQHSTSRAHFHECWHICCHGILVFPRLSLTKKVRMSIAQKKIRAAKACQHVPSWPILGPCWLLFRAAVFAHKQMRLRRVSNTHDFMQGTDRWCIDGLVLDEQSRGEKVKNEPRDASSVPNGSPGEGVMVKHAFIDRVVPVQNKMMLLLDPADLVEHGGR